MHALQVDFDRNAAKRTNVIDDQSDFFEIDSNAWLSDEVTLHSVPTRAPVLATRERPYTLHPMQALGPVMCKPCVGSRPDEKSVSCPD